MGVVFVLVKDTVRCSWNVLINRFVVSMFSLIYIYAKLGVFSLYTEYLILDTTLRAHIEES